MLDKTVPYFNVILANNKKVPCGSIDFPPGYTCCGYEDGLEIEWVKMAMEANQFATFAEALKYFDAAFLTRRELLNKQMIFVKDILGTVVATGTIWAGHNFGRVLPRIHFVCVHSGHQGKRIHGAIVSKLLSVYYETEVEDFVYMTSTTWNYLEIHEYLSLGFEPYVGDCPTNWSGNTARFDKNKVIAWEIIMNKIHEIFPPPPVVEAPPEPPPESSFVTF